MSRPRRFLGDGRYDLEPRDVEPREWQRPDDLPACWHCGAEEGCDCTAPDPDDDDRDESPDVEYFV